LFERCVVFFEHDVTSNDAVNSMRDQLSKSHHHVGERDSKWYATREVMIMLARRLPTLAMLAALPWLLANCSSDDPTPTNTAGTGTTAGTKSGGSPSGGGGAASGGMPSAGTSSGGSGTSGTGGKAGGTSGGSGGAVTGGSSAGGASSGGGGASAGGGSGGSSAAGGSSGGSTGGTFKLSSAEIMEGQTIGADYTCTSKMGYRMWGVAPSFKWENPPAGTMSYAFFVIDWTLTMAASPDVNGYHSAAWNIPSTLTSLNKGWMAADLGSAAKSINGAYLGPCPPNGPDTYHMIVMALPMASYTVTATGQAGVKSTYEMLKAVALATSEITGTYKQP
jgi:phosphatidylethanolamine-binding protein (PEBP) family uncharacterized protein